MKTTLALAALAAIIVTPALAEGTCATADMVQQRLVDATHTPEYQVRQIKIDKPDALKALMETIAAVAGYPPGKDKITFAVVYKPSDLDKYNVYIAFFGADGCKVTAIMLDGKVIAQMLQGVSAPLHLLAPGQRDT